VMNAAVIPSIATQPSRTENTACPVQLGTAARGQEAGRVSVEKTTSCCQEDPDPLT